MTRYANHRKDSRRNSYSGRDPLQGSARKALPRRRFLKALGIDSLQTLDLLTKLENHFHVELPDYELQGVSDFRTLADKIQARL